MRVLFTCVTGYGHLNPLLPLAGAMADAGHEVAIATGGELQWRVESAGLSSFCAGIDLPDAFRQLLERFPDRRFERLVPTEIVNWYLPHLFGEIIAPAMLDDLQDIVPSWCPDIIVHDTAEFAGPIVAAERGIPSVCQTLGLRFEGGLLNAIATAVAPLWRQRGLVPDTAAGLYRHLCLDIMPDSLRSDELSPFADRIRPLRPMAPAPLENEVLHGWIAREPALPLVYMTLGTFTNSDVSVFRGVIDGLADLDVRLLVTVGPSNDPRSVGPLPANAHVERYAPQSTFLPLCSVVVCHGGAGTSLDALAHGIPLLLLPQGADQYIISERIVSAGAGLCLSPAETDPAAVRMRVRSLLNDADLRGSARRVQREIAAMPAPTEVVSIVHDMSRAG